MTSLKFGCTLRHETYVCNRIDFQPCPFPEVKSSQYSTHDDHSPPFPDKYPTLLRRRPWRSCPLSGLRSCYMAEGLRCAIRVTGGSARDAASMACRCCSLPARVWTPTLLAPTTGRIGALLNSAHVAVDQRALVQPLVVHLQDIVRDGGANGLCRCIRHDSCRGNTQARQTASPLSSTCKLDKHMPNNTQLPSGRMANLQPGPDRVVHAAE